MTTNGATDPTQTNRPREGLLNTINNVIEELEISIASRIKNGQQAGIWVLTIYLVCWLPGTDWFFPLLERMTPVLLFCIGFVIADAWTGFKELENVDEPFESSESVFLVIEMVLLICASIIVLTMAWWWNVGIIRHSLPGLIMGWLVIRAEDLHHLSIPQPDDRPFAK